MRKVIIAVLCLSVLTAGCASSGSVRKVRGEVESLDERVVKLEQAQGIQSQPLTGDVKMSGTVTMVSEKGDMSAPVGDVNMSKKDVQRALRKAGYYHGAIDGKLGSQSRNAIKEFQEDHGLKIDGIAGPQTQKVLSRYM